MILIFVSFEEKEHAEIVANYLIDKKLAACVSFMPVQSVYIWDGKKSQNQEIEAIIKTTEEKFEAIEKAIKELVSYDIPQIISVKAEKVQDKYMQWVKDAVS